MQGIYFIRNKKTNMRYIGSSLNIESRFEQHKKSLNRYKDDNENLQNAWNYEKSLNNDVNEIFLFEIFKEMPNNTEKEIRKYEKELIIEYKRLGIAYNIRSYSECVSKNWKCKRLSSESREKISNTLKEYYSDAENRKKSSKSHKGQWTGDKNPNYGGLSEEHKEKISQAQSGSKSKNTKITEEQVIKVCELLNQNKYDYQQIANIVGISKNIVGKLKRKERWKETCEKYLK